MTVGALEAHRSVTESIGPDALRDMLPAARERALRSELHSAEVLHPALVLPEGHYRVGLSGAGVLQLGLVLPIWALQGDLVAGVCTLHWQAFAAQASLLLPLPVANHAAAWPSTMFCILTCCSC